jgi:cell division septum initiation protein DivIVA
LVTSAKAESDRAIDSAERHATDVIRRAEQQADLLIADAEHERRQVLDDLGVRRDALSAQVDRLLLSRQNLADLVVQVRSLADTSLDELDNVAVAAEPLAGGLDHVGQVTTVHRESAAIAS